ncbi:MAG: TonB-dependent receptor [candidate division WOR-3 bacterium]
MNKIFVVISILLIILGLNLVFAGETGRIIGRVIDADTKQPLVGVNIIIEGTPLGAATDNNGFYLITNVPAGLHTIVASYVGYEPVRMSDVLVISDQTITVNFTLRSTVIPVGAVEVSAERPLIVRTQAATQRVITKDEFDRLPVASLGAIVNLSAGVVQSPTYGTHLRGGRPDEIVYFVDGIATTDPLYGYSAARINPQATAEVLVISGGFDAEYGEAMSGIVSVVTREGRDNFSLRAKYTSDAFLPEPVNFGYNRAEVSIGGPLPINKMKYFLSGEVFIAEDYAPRKFKLPHQNRQDYKVTTKLTYIPQKLTGLKLTTDGFLSREQWEQYPSEREGSGALNHIGFKYHLDHFLSRQERVRKAGLSVNHMISKNTFYTIRYGYFWDERVIAVRDLEKERALGYTFGWKFWQDYQFKALDAVRADTTERTISGILPGYQQQRNNVVNNPFGVSNLFYGVGDYRYFLFHGSRVHTIKGDLTHNIGKVHEFKTGFELRNNFLFRRYNSLPWDPNPFYDFYNYRPVNLAVFIQDRMDFEDLVVRVGVRLDYLDPKAYKRANPTNIEDPTMVRAQIKYKFSPRLGISFPIGEKAKFRFSYGHFYQTPAYRYLFDNITQLAYSRGNMIIGNPDLRAQQTVAYEVGSEVLLSTVTALDFTAYYKDIYDLIGIRFIPAVPTGYYPICNEEYGNVRGIEIGLIKQLANYWSGRLSYGLSYAKGTASYGYEYYYERYAYGVDPVSGREMEPPKREYTLDFDERHSLKLDLGVDLPADYFIVLARNLKATMLFNYGSGLPYTPREAELRQGLNSGRRTGEKNSLRMPPRWSTDLKLVKGITIGKIKFNLTCDIINLFDTKNIEWVYGYTGRPDDDGNAYTYATRPINPNDDVTLLYSSYHPARDINSNGIVDDYEEYVSYLTAWRDFVNNPMNYGAPRQIRFGIDFEF